MLCGEDLAAAASSRQHLHLVAVLHRDEGCGNHPRRITQDEVALGLTEHENAVMHGDLAFGQCAVQRRRSRIAQTARPIFEEQPRRRIVRPARNTSSIHARSWLRASDGWRATRSRDSVRLVAVASREQVVGLGMCGFAVDSQVLLSRLCCVAICLARAWHPADWVASGSSGRS